MKEEWKQKVWTTDTCKSNECMYWDRIYSCKMEICCIKTAQKINISSVIFI